MHKAAVAGGGGDVEVGLLQRHVPVLDDGVQAVVRVLAALVLREEAAKERCFLGKIGTSGQTEKASQSYKLPWAEQETRSGKGPMPVPPASYWQWTSQTPGIPCTMKVSCDICTADPQVRSQSATGRRG